ncbi:ABC transporter permease [Geodermatophilus sp. YIM 151500]|uniref:ABC transporter permease n=1 Tax=Geodermatophilus sp. YIM 151500 TaxID=2984531 RepID=UPI0021E4FDF9|nr:ABC transporter permease [Geodermatophilus sp. YIM 151500]MCV2489296.1 ABC transporter permease [Geodermatophilus sp. YIM 151500]
MRWITRGARFVWHHKLVSCSMAFLVVLAFAAVFRDAVTPYDPYSTDVSLRNLPPLSDGTGWLPHVLGTDPLGRDLLSVLVEGARVSLVVGLLSVLVSGTFGVVLGLAAGYFRGRTDDVVMRLVDLQMSVPSLLIALLVLYVLGPSLTNVVFVLAITRWMVYARVTRGLMLSMREELFVEAARSLGASHLRIIVRHMIPNIMAPIMVLATLEMAVMLLTEASLSFLGLGIQPPQSSWGLMLAQGREYLTTAWWLVTFPGLAILLTTLSINIIATWMRARSTESPRESGAVVEPPARAPLVAQQA